MKLPTRDTSSGEWALTFMASILIFLAGCICTAYLVTEVLRLATQPPQPRAYATANGRRLNIRLERRLRGRRRGDLAIS